jgi:hypothetical protein
MSRKIFQSKFIITGCRINSGMTNGVIELVFYIIVPAI